jgi:hypothetical protein
MTDLIKRWRRRIADWLRSWAGRVDPGWPLPAQYTAGHILRYHELMIDVGMAEMYDHVAAGDGAAAGSGSSGESSPDGPTTAPPTGVRHNADDAKQEAAEAMDGANGGLSRTEAQKVRRAFAGEIERLNMIVLDIDEGRASDVPVDVTVTALRHFVPVYVAATTAPIGTGVGMMQA